MHRNNVRRNHGDKNVQLSKAMSWLLRHGAQKQGVKMDSAGYISVEDLIIYLKRKGFKDINFEKIKQIVDNNDKQRFRIKQENNHYIIRANQGHSLTTVCTEDLLTKIQDSTIYPVVIHGTYMKFWPLIKQGGLNRMSRNHIHFAPGRPNDKQVISGIRTSCDVIIQIDMVAAMKAGISFFISANNVILTSGIDGAVPTKFFKSVVTKNGQVLMGNYFKNEQSYQNKKVQQNSHIKKVEQKQQQQKAQESHQQQKKQKIVKSQNQNEEFV